MKKIISHRGNLTGPNPKMENNPDYIMVALSKNYEVEIDVWFSDKGLYLGHDQPSFVIPPSFLKQEGLWCHAKNLEALEYLLENNMHCFWHNEDKVTLTSWGIPWCYPYVYVNNGITVEKGTPHTIEKNVLGVCTDYALGWKNFMEKI